MSHPTKNELAAFVLQIFAYKQRDYSKFEGVFSNVKYAVLSRLLRINVKYAVQTSQPNGSSSSWSFNFYASDKSFSLKEETSAW
jgi:hypothetical protein